MERKKKALALIYDPHNLHQFLWYYCTHAKQYEWTALCLPNGFKGEYMSEYCKKAGVFTEIIRDDKEFLSMSFAKKMIIFLQMFSHALFRKQKQFCKKLLNQYVDIDQFDEAVVLTDAGIVSGAIIALGDEKDVVILEDGMGDYLERSKKNILKNLFDFSSWQNFLLAWMGYACPGHVYPLKTTKYCNKYSSHPEKMPYKEFKTIHKLFELDMTDMILYKKLISRVYEEIEKYDFEKSDVVVFTDRLEDFTTNDILYKKRFEKYINSHYKNILLKKHPRDDTKYDFSIGVYELNGSIPAEVFLPYLEKKEIVFMYATSILLYVDNNRTTILYFDGLYEDNDRDGLYMTKEKMCNFIEGFGLDNYKMIEI